MGIRYAIQISLLLALGTALTACAKPSTEYSLSSDLVRYEGVSSSGEFTQQELVRDPARSEYGQNDWVASKASASAVVKGTPGLNRVNFVFIGDGYTRAELAAYAKDVDRSVDAMLKQEPFKTYRNYFSFARVDVVSKQSGVTRANGGIVRSALGMNYGCAGLPRLLCINLEKAIKEAKNAKMHDIVFAMANSDEYGGAGYLKPKVATFAAKNQSSFELALHELGHSFGGLGDEYEQEGVEGDCEAFENVSSQTRAQMQAAKTKWFRWLDLPHVSAFPGACYSSFYRPTEGSKMRNLGRPFEEVNTELLIQKIYEKVRPIQAATPAGTYTRRGVFFVDVMKPEGRPLKIRWSLNGNRLSEFDGFSQIDASRLNVPASGATLLVTVVDETSAVRDEELRRKLLTQTMSWKLKP